MGGCRQKKLAYVVGDYKKEVSIFQKTLMREDVNIMTVNKNKDTLMLVTQV